MKSTALWLASIAMASLVLASDNPDVGTPEALIRSLYAHHQPGKDKNLDWCDRKAISQFTDARLTDLFMKDCACARRTQEFCQLNSDPFYDAQDFDSSDPDPRIKRLASNSFEVTINSLGDHKLIYTMKKTRDGWRVSDITYPSNKWSLIKLLSVTQK